MIPHTLPTWQSQSWQQQLADTIRDPQELCRLLQLDVNDFKRIHLAPASTTHRQFPLRVPRAFLKRMQPGDMHDPLLLQVLPQAPEAIAELGYSTDPLAETQASPSPGIIHKYHGRALLMLTGACAIHCRYCFRRHFPYHEHRLNQADWQASLAYLRNQTSIREVIYSGGDPLALGDEHLAWLTWELAAISHINTLRIHTRLPVVIPDRIDDACLEWLASSRLQVVVVIHCNHANEIDSAVAQAVARLRARGIIVLNQSVLLQGINDSVQALATLSKNLFKIGVLPYYLHLLDSVAGAHHFMVDIIRAKSVHNELQALLPGYLVPKLVREIPNAASKEVLG